MFFVRLRSESRLVPIYLEGLGTYMSLFTCKDREKRGWCTVLDNKRLSVKDGLMGNLMIIYEIFK